MWYIGIQQLDYDDYPVGREEKIGPFESQDEADDWLTSSELFYRHYLTTDYYEWKRAFYGLNHSVRVKDLHTGLIHPENYRG